jgi:2-succinyl-5-enolpyruvyl-6-hydroxy-3-cyclohexene-1-carboxylate synthase
MKYLTSNLNTLWASLLIEELVRNGLDYFCLAPGSRSTPLVVAVAAHDRIEKSIHHDERAVGFHALGYARATGRPAGVVTTSGTAAVNLMPAIVEASLEQIPLIILTADRPPELRDTCANQTIDQTKLFGSYVRWFVDLPCPSERISSAFPLTTADQAFQRCRRRVPGPVQLNCMFREPLEPEPGQSDYGEYLKPLDRWVQTSLPYTTYDCDDVTSSIDPATLDRIVSVLEETERGLVVIGALDSWTSHEGVRALLEKLQWPVCADVTSGFRMGDTSELVMTAADVLAMHQGFSVSHAPEVVLHLGGRLVSKQTERFLHQACLANYVVLSGHRGRQDAWHDVTIRLEGEVNGLCSAVTEKLTHSTASSLLKSWQTKTAMAETFLGDFANHATELSEPLVARLISKTIPAEHGLFLANSTPVRSVNRFADGSGAGVCVEANRGASGIDGTMAAAAGFAAGLQRPVTLLVGDLAFLHDLNALNYLVTGEHPVIAVVVNNNGGGIFSFLPISRFEFCFEKYFVAPHGLTFEKAALMYGLPYSRPADPHQFLEVYRRAVNANESALVEVAVDRKKDYALHTRLIDDVHRAISLE